MKSSWFRSGVLVGGAMLFAAACSSSPPVSVTLSAEGTADSATISYRTADGEETVAADLPWELTVEVSGNYSLSLDVVNDAASGEVTCSIEGDGRPVRSEGEASANCRVSKSSSGGGTEYSTSSSGERFTRVDGVAVIAPNLRISSPISGSPRAFVIVGETAWAAEGGSLTGWDAATGSTVRTSETRGTNDAVTVGDTIYAVVNNAAVNAVVEVSADGTERVFETPNAKLDGPLAVGPDEIWLAAREPERIIRLDRASGEQVGEFDVEDGARLVASTEDLVVLCIVDEDCRLLDWDGEPVAATSPLDLESVIEFEGGLLGFDQAEGGLAVVDSGAESIVRSGVTRIGTGSLISASESVLAVGGEGDVTLVDPQSLEPLCVVETSFRFLGASDEHLWFVGIDRNEWVLYPISELGCPMTAEAIVEEIPEEPTEPAAEPADNSGDGGDLLLWTEMVSTGDCFDDVLIGDNYDFTVPPAIVDCAQPHDNEVVAAVVLGEDTDPSDAVTAAEAPCAEAFETFFGGDRPGDLGMVEWWIAPGANEWEQGSRTAICAVYGDGPLVGVAQSAGMKAPGHYVAVVGEVDGITEVGVTDGDGTWLGTVSTPGVFAQRTPPSWSADGLFLLFAEGPDDLERTIHISSGLDDVTPLLEGVEAAGSPAIDPSGTKVAYIAAPDGGEFDVFVLDRESGESVKLTENTDRDTSPQWSPDGSRIAYRARIDDNSDVWVMNADGTEATRLTDDAAFDGDPVWSPDGSQLAFTSDRTGDFEIWVMNADGTEQRLLTNHPANDEFPSWSDDGLIVFQSDRHGDDAVWVMLADGTEQSRLSWESPLGYPSISPTIG